MAQELSVGGRVKHPKYGVGVIFGMDMDFYKVFFREHGDKEIAREYEGWEVIDYGAEVDNELKLEHVEEALFNVLERYADFTVIIPLGDKWKGGTMSLLPADTSLKGKDIPIETFFHKIVMVRDRLRVLEQNVNSHKSLSDEEKVHLQQYITRIYGSLTTFNILFAKKEHQFKGESGGKEE